MSSRAKTKLLAKFKSCKELTNMFDPKPGDIVTFKGTVRKYDAYTPKYNNLVRIDGKSSAYTVPREDIVSVETPSWVPKPGDLVEYKENIRLRAKIIWADDKSVVYEVCEDAKRRCHAGTSWFRENWRKVEDQ